MPRETRSTCLLESRCVRATCEKRSVRDRKGFRQSRIRFRAGPYSFVLAAGQGLKWRQRQNALCRSNVHKGVLRALRQFRHRSTDTSSFTALRISARDNFEHRPLRHENLSAADLAPLPSAEMCWYPTSKGVYFWGRIEGPLLSRSARPRTSIPPHAHDGLTVAWIANRNSPKPRP
jgi:hypothetical protein